MVNKEVEKIFGIETVNADNYKYALTHPSYIKDNDLPYTECYERLEFLGDAVLKLAVSNILYKEYPKYTEGQMSKIRSIVVSDNILAKIANEIGLDKLIIAGVHDTKQGIKKLESVTACSLEATLGAYFLDGKFHEVMNFLDKVLHEYIIDVDKNFEKFNAKAILQEYTQGLTKETPVYNLVESKGAEHNKTFVVEVSYRGEVVAQGEGKTKKEAEQHAAYSACEKLGAIKHE
ncbi:ribonuclease III [bacterium]|nr:ribonuclease III [bacterium]